MPSSHFALFLIILAMSWQSRGFAQPPVPPPLTSTDPDAAALLDSNVKALTRPEGVEVKFTQAIGNRKEGAKFTGRVVTASNNRTLVEVDFKQVGRSGAVKLVCDGTTFHRFESLPELKQRVSYTLKDLQEALDKLATSEAERVAKLDVEKEQQGVHGFAGQIFADRRAQHGAPIGAARIGCAPRAFELHLVRIARGVGGVDLPERQGAAIAQLPRPMAKLVSAVHAGMKLCGVFMVACQQRQCGIAVQPVWRQA